MKRIIKWLLLVFIFMVLLIVYARYVGTNGFITKEYLITSNDIPLGYDGIKIVHFSDLHYNRAIDIDKVKSIVSEINKIRPDIVVFTGDMIDRDVTLKDSDFKELADTLKDIDANIGKYAIIGNHDFDTNYDKVIELYSNSDFKYLENDYDIIYNTNNEKIFIGGIGSVSYNKDDIEKMLSYFDNNNDDMYKIILVHEPDISDKIINKKNVNLILAGHSHNGQIRLPFIGAVYTPPYAKKYYDNYYKIKDTDLYISSGIGVSSVNYRLFNPPSINFYRINRYEKNNT